ncbi:unnamed protein product, partial [Adineta steineri]
VAHVSPEQSDPDRYTSSQLNITTSRNIDDENISEVDEDAFNQPSATVEDRFYQSSSTTRRLSVFLTISSIMIQNKSAEVSHVQISFSNLNLKELHHIHTSQILSLTQQCENESNRTVNSDESSSTVTDKRKTVLDYTDQFSFFVSLFFFFNVFCVTTFYKSLFTYCSLM